MTEHAARQIVREDSPIWRGYSLAEMLVPCGILVAVGAAAFAFGTAAFRAAR